MTADDDITLVTVRQYTNSELQDAIRYFCMERKVPYRAECIYWLCILEQHRRDGQIGMEYMDLKCVHNIFDEDREYIFRAGNKYRLHEVDNILLIINDKLKPYVFTAVEGDTRCVWKYFSLWTDNNPGTPA